MTTRPSILRTLAAALLACAAVAPALAQPVIDPAHKFSWQENCGWMNWAGAPPAKQVSIAPTYLRGVIWCENIGWIVAGRGPINKRAYSNTSGADAGVNRDAAGALSGFAWSENAGWINFSGGALASPPSPARFDAPAKRFRGYAWAENIGWINLDDAAAFVGTLCRADLNGDGQVTLEDLFSFLSAWFVKSPSADFNGNGTVSVQDLFDFLGAWFARC